MPSPFPNPPLDVNALIAPLDGPTVLRVIVNALVSTGVRADLWPVEGTLMAVTTQIANVIASVVNFSIIPAIKSGWLPTAVGAWLTWVAFYMYGVSRITATFAAGSVTLSNAGGGTYAFDPFTATFQNVVTKATYTNVDPIALAPGPGTSQTLAVQATAVGRAGNAAPGQIATLVTTMAGVSVTNAAPVLGIDEQSDDSLKVDAWNSIAANSPFGPRQSFSFAVKRALNAVTGSPVNVNRFVYGTSEGVRRHTGIITIYVASPDGLADPNDVLGIANNIEATARPECVTVIVQSCSVVVDADVLTVYVRSTPGLTAATVQAAIVKSLAALFAGDSNPIGGSTAGAFTGFFAAAVEGACYDAWPPKPADPTAPWASAVFEVTGAVDHALATDQVMVDSLTVNVSLI